jgi:hypothetical protein
MFTKEILDNMRDLVTSLSADCGAARDETGSEDDYRSTGGASLTESADAGTPRDAAKAASALTRCGPT